MSFQEHHDMQINDLIKGDLVYYHGGFRTPAKAEEIRAKRSRLALESARKRAEKKAAQKIPKRECLKCDAKFAPKGPYNRLCPTHTGKYSPNMWVR